VTAAVSDRVTVAVSDRVTVAVSDRATVAVSNRVTRVLFHGQRQGKKFFAMTGPVGPTHGSFFA
jgi:hypothetical protein